MTRDIRPYSPESPIMLTLRPAIIAYLAQTPSRTLIARSGPFGGCVTHFGQKTGGVGTAQVGIVISRILLSLSNVLDLGFTNVCRSVGEDGSVEWSVLWGWSDVGRVVRSVDLLRLRHDDQVVSTELL